MNPAIEHPLMLVPDLDSRCVGTSRRAGHTFWRGRIDRSLALRVPDRRGIGKKRKTQDSVAPPERRVTRSQTKALQSADRQYSYSESDSEDETESGVAQECISGLKKDSPKITASLSVKDQKLLKDLQISDESEIFSSSESDSTEPDDTASEKSSDGTAIEPLWTSLIGEGYFWIKKTKATLKKELNFSEMSIDSDDKIVVQAFKIFCREVTIEKAVMGFAEKLKHLSLKKCLSFLHQYRQIFKTQFFHPKMKSMYLFGTIVMTLACYYYNKNDFLTAVALINFIDIDCKLNPLDYQPYYVQNATYMQLTVSATAHMCCDAAYRNQDFTCCTRLFSSCLKNFVGKMDLATIDRLKPLLRTFFQHLISANIPRPLIILFSNVFDVQENLEHPFNLSEFYAATISVLVASDDSYNHRLIVNLFLKVSPWSDVDLTAVACRGLLLAAAELNEPRTHIELIFRDAVYAGAYPYWELFDWKVSLYSVMTKVEMQIYIELFFHSRAEFVWTKRLPMCSTYILFHVEPVSSSTVREYVYPVQQKIRHVDNSVPAAIDRLKTVIEYLLEQPADEFVKRYDENGLIMFSKDVEKLFKKILRVDSFERTPESVCILCK